MVDPFATPPQSPPLSPSLPASPLSFSLSSTPTYTRSHSEPQRDTASLTHHEMASQGEKEEKAQPDRDRDRGGGTERRTRRGACSSIVQRHAVDRAVAAAQQNRPAVDSHPSLRHRRSSRRESGRRDVSPPQRAASSPVVSPRSTPPCYTSVLPSHSLPPPISLVLSHSVPARSVGEQLLATPSLSSWSIVRSSLALPLHLPAFPPLSTLLNSLTHSLPHSLQVPTQVALESARLQGTWSLAITPTLHAVSVTVEGTQSVAMATAVADHPTVVMGGEGGRRVRMVALIVTGAGEKAQEIAAQVTVLACSATADLTLYRDLLLSSSPLERTNALDSFVVRQQATVRSVVEAGMSLSTSISDFRANVLSVAGVSGAPRNAAAGSLLRTGSIGGGVAADWLRRMSWSAYCADWHPRSSSKVASSIVYMYAAVIVPTVAFGGLLSEITEGAMGVSETVLSQGLAGLGASLLYGQALTTMRPSETIVAFIQVTHFYATSLGVPFLTLYSLTAAMSAVALAALAIADAAVAVRYMTPFSEDIFEAVVSVIFLGYGLGEIARYLGAAGEYASVGALSVGLVLSTAAIAHVGGQARSSLFLSSKFRSYVAVASVLLAVAIPTIVAHATRGVWWGVESETGKSLYMVPMPESAYEPSLPGRSWWLWQSVAAGGIGSVSASIVGVAALLGLLLAFVLFAEQSMTEKVLWSKAHRLQRGGAFHWDLLAAALLAVPAAALGLPVAHGALPYSLYQLNSLSISEDIVSSEGEPRRRILDVQETRIPGLVVSLLVLATGLVLPTLHDALPVPCVMGVILWIGVTTILHNPIVVRLLLVATDSYRYPVHHVIRVLPPLKVHGYTAIQVGLVGLIYVVKSIKVIGAFFVLILFTLPSIRSRILPLLYTQRELQLLDADEDEDEEDTTYS